MDTTTLNETYLTAINACADAIDFVKRNGLENFPLNRLHEIKGDFYNYKGWIQRRLEHTYTFDEKNRVIQSIHSNGFWCNYTYDINGNELHYKDSNDFERWTTYNQFNKPVTHKTSKNLIVDYVYDGRGNLIQYRNNEGAETFSTYDENNNQIIFETKNYRYVYSYDKNNFRIKQKGSMCAPLPDYVQTGDERGNVLSFSSKNTSWTKTYNDKNQVLTYQNEKAFIKNEYDIRGNLISVDTNDNDYKAIYDFYENGQLKSVTENDFVILEIPLI